VTDSVRQIRLAPAGNTGAHTSKPHWLGGLLIVIVAAPACADEFHVSPAGSDSSPGTKAEPFRTIQKAADVMAAGDTCYIRPGTYKQTVRPKRSGRKGKPIRFVAAERIIKGFTDGYKGKAPDIGAYEFGGENWRPGADWEDHPLQFPPVANPFVRHRPVR